jgi:DNA polymerase elongation subunit (family B)
MPAVRQEAESKAKVQELLQWALKIAANSLYGCLAFRDYNTYSPRCGMSVSAAGRWSLTVAICIVQSLGCIVVYGDTDSVMFTIPEFNQDIFRTFVTEENPGLQRRTNVGNRSLLPYYVDIICSHLEIDRYEACESICGSTDFGNIGHSMFKNMVGVVCKIVNIVMSYTSMARLKVESQETEAKTELGNKRYVFSKMVVLASKHYIARDMSGNPYSKGVSYVRRTGSLVSDLAAKQFSAIILGTSSKTSAIKGLRREYQVLLNNIRSRKYPEIYRVRATKNAVTKDFVRIVPRPGANKGARYAEFEQQDEETVGLGFYTEVVKSCLRSICKCIGLPDEKFITDYQVGH